MVSFYLTGALTLVGPDATVHERELPGVQGRTLVALLALERRPLARDVIADHLWADAPPDAWQRALNPLVSRVRSRLAALDSTGACSLRTTSGCLELRLPPHAWVDVEDAVTRLDRAEGALRRGDHEGAWSDAAVAVAILRRGLLPGCDGEWVERRRTELADRLVRAWLVIGEVWHARLDLPQARQAANAAIEIDPFREEAHRLLIRTELAAGNQGRAAQALAACRELLRRELGVGPSAETERIGDAINGG